MKKIFSNLFSRPPITKSDKYIKAPTDFKGFFVVLGRKFWNLSTSNMIFVLANFPIFFLLFTFAGHLDKTVTAVLNPLYPAFYGFSTISDNSFLASISERVSQLGTISVPTAATKVFWALSLLTVITFGLSNAGFTYLLRGYTRGDGVFVFGDFFGAIKRNWKQAIILGILDILACIALIWDCIFWSAQAGYGFLYAIFFYLSLFFIFVYVCMRFYAYTIMITFDLSIKKILKNSFIFAFLGAKRNIVALLGIAVVAFTNYMLLGILLPAAVMLPVIITISLCSFMAMYASYPVIKKYMIDPYYPEQTDDTAENGEDDTVFEDRG